MLATDVEYHGAARLVHTGCPQALVRTLHRSKQRYQSPNVIDEAPLPASLLPKHTATHWGRLTGLTQNGFSQNGYEDDDNDDDEDDEDDDDNDEDNKDDDEDNDEERERERM